MSLSVKSLYFGCIALLLGSCAQQGMPTGGEKDTTPPGLVEATPANRQTSFKGNQVVLTFNEYVQLNNPREQLIVIPPIDNKKLEVTARRNKIYIRFNQPLQDTTTYTINFREAVQDITERNPAHNLKLAFSTGPHIDTLIIRGRVVHHLTGEPVENCIVALAHATDTTDIFKHKPRYFTLSDKAGNYQLDNIKKGKYLVYAFLDKNKNLLVDSQSEIFGFKSQPVELIHQNLDINLSVLKLDMRPLKLLAARPVGNVFLIRLNKGFLDVKLKPADTLVTLYYSFPEPSVINLYNTFNLTDSLAAQLTCNDSIGNKIDTLLYIKFARQGIMTDKFELTVNGVRYYDTKNMIIGKINFSKPVVRTIADSIFIHADTTQSIRFESSDFTWNETRTEAAFSKHLPVPLNFEQKQQRKPAAIARQGGGLAKAAPDYRHLLNHIIIAKGAFISADNDSSAMLTSQIKLLKPEEFSTLLYEVETNNLCIVQVTGKNKLVASSTGHSGRFSELPPDTYRLKAFIDTNENGKWDWGNFYLKQEPEPVWFYYENNTFDIPAKANWEVGPLWIRPPKDVDK
ncbi:MAG: hypothetical protein KatS3mg032_1410 [Cyclobacteriaceae bacterium]|nr:MAG: hypothetical protein KatS3mg032_1410 [Cyclobacteriaceae bacterium]